MPAAGQFKYDWSRVIDEIDARGETNKIAAQRLGVSQMAISLNRSRLGKNKIREAPNWAVEFRLAAKNEETVNEFAKRVGWSPAAVYQAAKRANFQFYKANREAENQNRDLILEGVRGGKSMRIIALSLGISTQRVHQIVLKYEATTGERLPRAKAPIRHVATDNPFYQWRIRMNLSPLRASVVLGCPERRIRLWDIGQLTPLTVRLAMAALEHRISPIEESYNAES